MAGEEGVIEKEVDLGKFFDEDGNKRIATDDVDNDDDTDKDDVGNQDDVDKDDVDDDSDKVDDTDKDDADDDSDKVDDADKDDADDDSDKDDGSDKDDAEDDSDKDDADKNVDITEKEIQERIDKAVREAKEKISLDDYNIKIGDESVKVTDAINEVKRLKDYQKDIESDEFIKGIIEHRKNGGDVRKYLEANVDYSKYDDMQMLKESFYKDNSDLNDSIKEKAFKRHLLNEYGYDLDNADFKDETDIDLMKGYMERDANRVRKSLTDEQSKFKIQERPQPEKKEEATQYDPQKFIESVSKTPEVKELLETGSIKLSANGEEFNYEVGEEKANQLLNLIADDQKFFKLFLGEDGKIDFQKVKRVYAHALDMDGYEKTIFEKGVNSSKKQSFKKSKKINDDPSGKSKTTDGNKNFKQGLADAFIAEAKKNN